MIEFFAGALSGMAFGVIVTLVLIYVLGGETKSSNDLYSIGFSDGIKMGAYRKKK